MAVPRSTNIKRAMNAERLWTSREPVAGPYYEDSTLRSEALCVGQQDRFIPDHKPTTDAKLLCRSCPVREQCLEVALSSEWEPIGIWGGISGPELRAKWQDRRSRVAA